MIGRRAALSGLALVLTAPRALGQAKARPRRLGMLWPGRRPPDGDIQITSFASALHELGYIDGQTIIIEYRFAEGELERLPILTRELLAAGVEIIVAIGASSTLAAHATTTTVPIVMSASVDPVALGVVGQLGKPIGNVTGVLISPDGSLAAKRLWLLQEAVPKARRFALLAPEADPTFNLQVRETMAAAAAAGFTLEVAGDRRGDYQRAFEDMIAAGTEALVVGSHSFFFLTRDRRAIIDLAAHFRLPAIYEWVEQVRDGGLMSYGASRTERYQRVASYVDRLFKGAKPSDLPFEQPAVLRMTVNLKTADALGLRLPDTLLARADEVIE